MQQRDNKKIRLTNLNVTKNVEIRKKICVPAEVIYINNTKYI